MRVGFVALIGLPNAGKSTLMNAIIGEKVSIVSPKPQTTRQRVVGIWNAEGAQIVFVDAPGVLHTASSGLNRFLIEEYQDVLAGADLAVLVWSPEPKFATAQDRVLEIIREFKKPLVAVVTKADLMDPKDLDLTVAKLKEAGVEHVVVSAVKGKAVTRELVLNLIAPRLPESNFSLYDDDIYTTQTVRSMAAEIVREKCFDNLGQELPYGLAIRIVDFKEEGKMTRINAEILLARENHKAIVIGRGGEQLKKIGSAARKELEKLIGNKVYLELFVKAKPDWMKNSGVMKELGYVIAGR